MADNFCLEISLSGETISFNPTFEYQWLDVTIYDAAGTLITSDTLYPDAVDMVIPFSLGTLFIVVTSDDGHEFEGFL